jgi:hypothetical protein
MVYRLWKNKSLYFSDLFWFIKWQPENPQFAFSYEFITTESGLKAVQKQRDGKRLLLQIANRLKETSESSNSLFMQINRHLSFQPFFDSGALCYQDFVN